MTDKPAPHSSPSAGPSAKTPQNGKPAPDASRGFQHLGAHIGFLLAILLLAANMRGSIVGLGPLAEIIGTDLSLSGTQLGLLTTLPVLSFGVLSMFAPRLGQKFGLEATLLTMLLFIAIGQGLRASGAYDVMVVGTVILGAAIAVLSLYHAHTLRRMRALYYDLPSSLLG